MASFDYRGRLRKDKRTKMLVQRLRPGEIALVEHADMDRLAAEALIRCGAKAVLNIEPFSRGIFPPFPVELLLKKGVYLLEQVNPALFELVAEGEIITLRGEAIYWRGQEVGRGKRINDERFREQCRRSRDQRWGPYLCQQRPRKLPRTGARLAARPAGAADRVQRLGTAHVPGLERLERSRTGDGEVDWFVKFISYPRQPLLKANPALGAFSVRCKF